MRKNGDGSDFPVAEGDTALQKNGDGSDFPVAEGDTALAGRAGQGAAQKSLPSPFFVLSDEMVAKIEALAPRYPNRQALTLPALHIVNAELRHVPLEAVVEIAQVLGLAPAEVQDTLTFYQFFHQEKPHGKVRAFVCRSVSCALRGGDHLLEHLCQKNGVEPYGTTPDGELTIEPAECLGACDFAPCILANDDLLKNMTPEAAEAELKKPRARAT